MRAVVPMVVAAALGCPAVAEQATNIILFIGDGMGLEQVRAAACYKGAPVCWESWPVTSRVATAAAGGDITDSAAAATAMATGTRVYNGVISMAYPGDGAELRTALETFKARGKRVGLVTTGYMTGATPAAFGAHASTRADTAGIARQYLEVTRPHVLFGGGGVGLSVEDAEAAGYLTVTDATGLAGLDTSLSTNVCGLFGDGDRPYETTNFTSHPHLREMTGQAIRVLTNGPAGFFLMVEGARIDHGCHDNNASLFIPELLELEASVQEALAWATNRTDTLIVVTADHETGGLTVLTDNGAGVLPDVAWSTSSHSAAAVGVWAWGVNGEGFRSASVNTDLYHRVVEATLPRTSLSEAGVTDGGGFRLAWTCSSGDVYRVESSGDLGERTWTPAGVVTAVSAACELIDTNAPGVSRRYYRLWALPE